MLLALFCFSTNTVQASNDTDVGIEQVSVEDVGIESDIYIVKSIPVVCYYIYVKEPIGLFFTSIEKATQEKLANTYRVIRDVGWNSKQHICLYKDFKRLSPNRRC